MQIEFLLSILTKNKPSMYIRNNEKQIFQIIPELEICKGFCQNNTWHIYDVYEHILHVVDGTSNNIILRLAALFHDIGKPFVYQEDENGIGHFAGHWDKSKKIFENFAVKYNLSKNIRVIVSNLILYHDLNMNKINDDDLKKIKSVFNKDGIIMLFELKRSDLLAQNKQYHYMLDDYNKQEFKILLKEMEVKK